MDGNGIGFLWGQSCGKYDCPQFAGQWWEPAVRVVRPPLKHPGLSLWTILNPP